MSHVEEDGRPVAILREVKPVWNYGVVLVCRECDAPSKRLRRAFKNALAEAGLRKRVRVVGCDCLDVCPKRATTVVTAGPAGVSCTIVPDVPHDRRTLAPILERFGFDRRGEKEAS